MKTLNEIILYSRKFLKENYNLELTHPIIINSRLTRSYGHVKFKKDYSDVIEISIAKRVVEKAHIDVLIDTIKHELIHYALWKLDKPFDDNDKYFKNELIKHNATAKNENGYLGEVYNYICSCGRNYKVEKNKNYRCHCNRPLKVNKIYKSDGINFELLKTID